MKNLCKTCAHFEPEFNHADFEAKDLAWGGWCHLNPPQWTAFGTEFQRTGSKLGCGQWDSGEQWPERKKPGQD